MTAYRVYVCHNRMCKERGAAQTWTAFERAVWQHDLSDSVELIVAGCQGRCDWGPNVTVHPGATKYSGVDSDAARSITAQHLAQDQPAREFFFDDR